MHCPEHGEQATICRFCDAETIEAEEQKRRKKPEDFMARDEDDFGEADIGIGRYRED